MNQFLFFTLIILSIVSCKNIRKNSERSLIDKHDKPAIIPDSFEKRDDTLKFKIDKGKLSDKTVTLDISYSAISCVCAQWFETKDSNITTERNEFYLERADTKLLNADTLYNGNNLPLNILVTGQFYENEGYPINYRPIKGNPNPARVFRYKNIIVKK